MFRESTAKGPRPTALVPPVRRRTVTEEVLDQLRDLLLRGVLRPGTRIDQAELAANFGVSTVPVREALLRLQSAGLVQLIPHRGVFVSEVSVEELLDIYTTRELLEEQAARLAARNLTATDIESLERVTESMQTAANKAQLDELLALNREFHFTIYRASKRRHLLQLIEQLWDLSTRYAHLQLHTVPDRASEALYEIRSIVSACKRKDSDALALMIRYKVHQTTTGLLQHMNLPETASTVQSASSVERARPSSKTLAKEKAIQREGRGGGKPGRAKPSDAKSAPGKKAKATKKTASKRASSRDKKRKAKTGRGT